MLTTATDRHQIARAMFALMLALGLILPGLPGPANAVTAAGKPATTVTPGTASSIAEYAFARFRTAKNENVTGCSITFPAGTTVTSGTVTAVDPAGSVVTTGNLVTITFDVPVVPEKTNFDITIGGIGNPGAGTYNAGNITLYWVNTVTGVTGSTVFPTGNYTITDSYISMTITTPGIGQSLDFGSIDPGAATPAQQVTVLVDSSAPYDILRQPGGDAGLLGLLISGDAVGPKPQGIATFTDTYQLSPPWTTDPSIDLTATVIYTVIQ